MEKQKTNYYYCVINFYTHPFESLSEHISFSITYTDESKLYNDLNSLIYKAAEKTMRNHSRYQAWELKILTKLN